MPQNLRRDFTPAAFTLVELLVVISVIVLLMALLLPVLGKARDAARSVMCMNHQKQLGMATNAYVNDSQDCLPQPDQDSDMPAMGGFTADQVQGRACWFNALDYYLLQQGLKYDSSDATKRNYVVFKQDPIWSTFPTAGSVQQNSRTIKMNNYLGDSNNDLNAAQPGLSPDNWHYFRIDDISKPSSTVLFFDGRSYDTRKTTDPSAYDTSGTQLFGAEEVYVGLRHANQSANVTLIDDHGENAAQSIRLTSADYQGWFMGPTATTSGAAGPQKYIWFHLGRNGVNDN